MNAEQEYNVLIEGANKDQRLHVAIPDGIKADAQRLADINTPRKDGTGNLSLLVRHLLIEAVKDPAKFGLRRAGEPKRRRGRNPHPKVQTLMPA